MKLDNNVWAAMLDNLFDGVYFVDDTLKITGWNKSAERISGYSSSHMIGSLCHDGRLSHLIEGGECACADSCQMKLAMSLGEIQEGERFLLHREGHRLAVTARTIPVFSSEGKATGAVQIFKEKNADEATQEKIEQLRKMAMIDPLTNLPNRRALESTIDMRLEESKRYGWPCGIMFIDVDRFKSINDSLGHAAGDMVLKLVAKTLLTSVRPFDLIGRYGGEEFIGLLVNISEDDLLKIANRAKFLVEKSRLKLEGNEIKITISIGATIAGYGEKAEEIIGRADWLMYKSKKLGGNSVSVSPGPSMGHH